MLKKPGILLLILTFSFAVFAQDALLYQNPDEPVEVRVQDLLSRMTLTEKVGQMTQVNVLRLMGQGEWDAGELNTAFLQEYLGDYGVGSVLSGGGSAPVPNTPEAWADMTNALQAFAVQETRLGIPVLYGVDAVHGHNNVLGAVVFPHNVGVAASFNPALAGALARATAESLRATGIHWNFAPVTDLGVDARWGRFYETYGEDPFLTGEFVRAAVNAYQQDDLSDMTSVAATVKHFVGYGAGAGGQDRAPADVSVRTLLEQHLPPAQAGLMAGAATVMANSGAVNGVPVHASRAVLTGLLRDQLEFSGVVVSDWEDIHKLVSVHKVARDFADAVAMSVNAGVDMYMVPNDARTFTQTLMRLVEEGVVSEARIDEAVTRILTLKFELGLFENPFVDATQANALVLDAHTDLALEAATQSMTLLKNNGVLPLNAKDAPAVLVAGNSADSMANQTGGWTIGWQGMPNDTRGVPGVTFVDGLRNALGETNVTHVTGSITDVADAATSADVAILFIGETPYAEGDGNTTNLQLPDAQLELIQEVTATGTPTVVVLIAGRPRTLPESILNRVDAFIMAYLPGSMGGEAMANVLTGVRNPSGRLPFSWPRETGQLPMAYNHPPGRTYDPLFPFGYGLSYTTFSTSNITHTLTNDTLTITLDVTNTGNTTSMNTTQIYVTHPPAGILTPEKQLIATHKTQLESGETKTITLEVPAERLSVMMGDVNSVQNAVLVQGEYVLSVNGKQVKFVVE